MKRVKYVGPLRPGVEIAATGQVVEHGQTVEVGDDLALALVQQSTWEPVGWKAPTSAEDADDIAAPAPAAAKSAKEATDTKDDA